MGVPYLGDYQPGAEITVWHNSFSSNDPSASVTMTEYTDTDVHIYKDDSLTQRANTAGMTLDIDVDTFAGVHKITINTADNTVNDFWEAGHDYAVVIEGTVIDGGTVNACVATFSIANRRVAGQMCSSSIEAYTDTTNFTLTTGEASANNDAYNGCTIIVTDQVTKIQKGIGHISDYVGNTRAIVLHAAPLATAFTWAVGDSVEIFATSAFANVNTVMQQTQTANDNGADINTLITETAKVPKSDSNVSWNATALGAIEAEAVDALESFHLDHLLAVDTTVAADGDLETYCVAGSIMAHLLSTSADSTLYKASTDSMQGIRDNMEAAVDAAMDNVIPADGSPTARSRDDFLLRAGATSSANMTINETTGAFSVKKIDAEGTEEKWGNTLAAAGTITSGAGVTTRNPS